MKLNVNVVVGDQALVVAPLLSSPRYHIVELTLSMKILPILSRVDLYFQAMVKCVYIFTLILTKL